MDDIEIETEISGELISSILLLSSTISSVPSMTPEIDKFLQTFSFVRYSSNEIKQIQSKYNNSHSTEDKLINILTEYSYNFPYSPSLLENIKLIDLNSIESYNFSSIIVLYSFLSWCCSIQKTKSMPNAKDLIKDLLFTRNSIHANLVDKTFISTIQIFLKFCNEDDLYSVEDDFLTYIKYIDSADLIIDFLNRFWKFPTFFNNPNFFDFTEKLTLTIETIRSNRNSTHHLLNFTESQINTIVKMMSTFITKLEPSALDLLVSIGQPLPIETAQLIIPTFGKSLETLVTSNKPLKFDDNENINREQNVVSFSKFESNDLQLDFPIIDSFPGGFNPNSLNKFSIPEPIHLNKIIDKKIIAIVEKFAKLISNNPNYSLMYIESFADSLRIHSNTEYFASLQALFLHSCDLIRQFFIAKNDIVNNELVFGNEYLFPTKTCFRFFNERIFNPSITIFNNYNSNSEVFDENNDNSDKIPPFLLINTFRNISLELMLSDDGTAIQNLLVDTFCSYPLLLAELFQRLSDNISIFYMKIQRNQQIIDTLIRISICYQRFEINAKNDTIEDIRKARISLFSFLSRLLSIPEILILFFSCRIPSMNFLAFSLEENLTKFVFDFYKNFLISATTEEIEITTPSIFSIFTVIVSRFSLRKSREILFTMLDSINDSMSNHPQINYLFADNCNVLFIALPLISASNMKKNSNAPIENTDKSNFTLKRSKTLRVSTQPPPDDITLNKKLLQEMVKFFAQTASFYSISEEQVDLLISALLSFKDPEYVLSSYNRFIQLLAGDCVPSLKPCFTIRQPQVLKLFIRVLIDSPKLIEILTFINELCKYSFQNIKTCANSEINLVLIDLLIRDKTEEKFSKETVELILDLFSILSIRHSSIRSVYKYINLMSMINSNVVYRHEQLLLNTLNTIINESMNEPSSSFALTKNNVLVNNILVNDFQIKQNLLSQGFTFVFWLNIEESKVNSEISIFKLTIDEDFFFRVSIKYQTLFMQINEPEANSAGQILVIPDNNIWHFVSITFYISEDTNYVSTEVDLQNYPNKLFFEPLTTHVDLNKPLNLTLSLGGKIEGNENSNEANSIQFPSRIANCGLFPILTADQQLELYEMGKRIANDTIIFSTSENVQPLKYFFEFKEQNSETTGFLDVLSQQCGLSSLLPLFKLRSMHFNDGTIFDIDFKFLLQFISRVLCSSFECQRKFYNESGFMILRRLIIENWMDQFTFKTYSTLFSLLQSLKYENLMKQLFEEILASFSFLKEIKVKQLQLRIIKNWQQSLFDSCRNLVLQTGMIKQILPAIINLFSEDIYDQHRKYFYKILNDCILSTGINIAFIEYIMYNSIICNNNQITKEIIDFLNSLVVETPREMFNFKFEYDSFVYFIEYFFFNPDAFIQIQILQVLINCHLKKLISSAFSSKIIFFIIESFHLHSIKDVDMKSIFDFISDNLIKAPFLLSLFFFLGIKLDIKDMKQYLNKKASPSYAFTKKWAIWPLLYCYKNPNQQENILTFLINSSKNNYCQLFSQVLFVFFNNNYCLFEQISQKFISILQAVTFSNNSVSPDFYEICEFIIMFKLNFLNAQKSSSRNDLAIKNNEKDGLNSSIPLQSNQASNNEIKICEIEKIASLPDVTPVMEFDMKLNKESMAWTNKTLAIQCIEIFHEQVNTGKLKSINNEENTDDNEIIANIMKRYTFFMLSLCAFLETKQYQNGPEFVKALNLKENDLNEYKVALQLINYHRINVGKEPILDLGKVINPLLFENNYRTFIEKNSPERLKKIIMETFPRFEKLIIHLRERTLKIQGKDKSYLLNEAFKNTSQFKINFSALENHGINEWKRLWTVLSFDNAPWHISQKISYSLDSKYHKESNDSSYDYKRSSVLYPFVPLKMSLLYPSILNSPIQGKPLFSIENNCFLLMVDKRIQASLFVYNDGVSLFTKYKDFNLLNNWINEVILRTYDNFTGFGIYTVFGVTFCIETSSLKDAKEFINYLNIKNKNSNLQMARYTRLWMDCKLSNFDYILMINKYSGRSFSDLSFYPIAPWITFSSDFNDTATNKDIRDLRKPFKNKDSLLSSKDAIRYLSNVEPFKSLSAKVDDKSLEISPSSNEDDNKNESSENTNTSKDSSNADNKPSTELKEKADSETTLNHEEPNQNSENNQESPSNESNKNNNLPVDDMKNDHENIKIESGTVESESTKMAANSYQNSPLLTSDDAKDSNTDASATDEKVPTGPKTEFIDELEQLSKQSESELIPEFYSFDHISSDGIQFVYKHRQLLESSNISANLHYWFSQAFPNMASLLSFESPKSKFEADRNNHFQHPFHPHRTFFIPNSEFDEPIMIETNISNFAAACFTSSMTVQIFTLNITNNVLSASSSSSSLVVVNDNINNKASLTSSSSVTSSLSNLVVDESNQFDSQNINQEQKKKNILNKIANSSQNDEPQNGCVLTVKFTIHEKDEPDMFDDFNYRNKGKYGKSFLPGILRSKEIKSDISLSSHLKEIKSGKLKNKSHHKNGRRKESSNINLNVRGEMKLIKITKEQKEITSPVFNNVTSIYNTSASCFIGPGSNQYQRSEFLTNYNYNLSKKMRSTSDYIISSNNGNNRIDISSTSIQIIPSLNCGFWVALFNNLVYVIETTDSSPKKRDSHRLTLDDVHSSSMNNSNSSLTSQNQHFSSEESKSASSGNGEDFVISILEANNVSSFCCDGLWIVVSVHSSSVLLVFYDKKLVNKIETFEDFFKCITFNERKKAVACLSRDSVIICDAVCGCVNCVIPSMKNAKKVLLSAEWGFIVVYVESKTKRKLVVFQPNGEFLRECVLDEKACFLKALKNVKGADFLIYSLESGLICVLNLFTGEVIGPVLKTGIFKVSDVFYNEEKSLLSVITIAGTVSFAPLNLSS